ncbi:ABC transporter permease [Bosea sp. BK604]|uniref:ABC transporter permease n=1 Tax=Bosea sp. BK604 TaxID=2512180 RepID=UPI00104D91AA|nr:ABC transporter permease [Bosea sp. BK604]TCR63050.1 peptide/nickel transport system permease protein [Bosea sp. BK604]
MTSARIEPPVAAVAGHPTRKSPWLSLFADPVTVTGLVLIVLFCLMAVFADLLAPYDPLKQNIMAMSRGPSSVNWLGTDRFGRDILSRVIHGAQPSLALGITAPLLAGVLGTAIGMLAGYFGGWIDRVIGRLSDVLMAFPSLLIGIMIAAALGPGFTNLVVAIAFAFLPRFIRVARASTMAIRAEPYIDAAIASGQGPIRILLRHVLPNISGPLVVVATLWVATAIRIEASLSFLGLGTQPPAPSWGNIIRDGLTEMLVTPWPVLAAGLAITICVLAFNMVGDAIRDALDPETRD